MVARASSEPARFARPIVVVSRCLGFEACRFDGNLLRSELVEALRDRVELRTPCPELGVGLGTPRSSLRLVRREDGIRLLQPATGEDHTASMARYGREFLEGNEEVDGFVLKNRSPSCGIRDAKIYPATDRGPALGKGPGAFAAVMLQAYPEAAFEDEGRLSDPAIRHHFLTRIFTLAEYRERVRGNPGRASLVRFHSRHKYLLLACDEGCLRRMGRLVARPEVWPLDALIEEYGRLLARALARGPRRGATINVLQHAYGYFSDRLTDGERRHFQELLEQYRAGFIPLSTAISTLQLWIERFDEGYLAEQSFHRPYPVELLRALGAGDRGALVHP